MGVGKGGKEALADSNVVTLQGWMVTELGLTGDALVVFAIVYGACQLGQRGVIIAQSSFCAWTGKGRASIRRTCRGLKERGFIQVEYEPDSKGILAHFSLADDLYEAHCYHLSAVEKSGMGFSTEYEGSMEPAGRQVDDSSVLSQHAEFVKDLSILEHGSKMDHGSNSGTLKLMNCKNDSPEVSDTEVKRLNHAPNWPMAPVLKSHGPKWTHAPKWPMVKKFNSAHCIGVPVENSYIEADSGSQVEAPSECRKPSESADSPEAFEEARTESYTESKGFVRDESGARVVGVENSPRDAGKTERSAGKSHVSDSKTDSFERSGELDVEALWLVALSLCGEVGQEARRINDRLVRCRRESPESKGLGARKVAFVRANRVLLERERTGRERMGGGSSWRC